MGQGKNSTKRRKWKQLQNWERNQIEALLKSNHSIKAIARQLGRDPRTIQCEKAKGTVQQLASSYRDVWQYFADAGQCVEQERAANKGRSLKIRHNHTLGHKLERLIARERYSPDAALGWLRVYEQPGMINICTKTLYRYIDCELFAGLSNKGSPVKRESKRRPGRIRPKAYNNLKGKSIEQRKKHVAARAEEGHWEMDCVRRKAGDQNLTAGAHRTRYGTGTDLQAGSKKAGLRGSGTGQAGKAIWRKFSGLFKRITVNNGSEYLLRTSLLCLGTRHNENQNKLIRRFVPKGTDIGKLTHRDV